jgi:L-rhamnose isomerase
MSAFIEAIDRYAQLGTDVEAALAALASIPISLQCWQGDDVGGFENPGGELTGGIAATGNYPGKARTIEELQADLDAALSLIPGRHRVNLHAIYGDFRRGHVERDTISIEQFGGWVDWARACGLGIDFNPTYFSHRLSADGFTLAHKDAAVRKFWIDHGIACRRTAAEIGRRLGNTVITNFWIPDGYKDTPVNRLAHRAWLIESLDAVFAEPIDPKLNRDAVESKLFGIGAESYTVGSHEFYLGYAVSRQKIVCLDAGHFHPTESVADKISSILLFVPEVLLHVSRGVRWDSDHIVTLDDQTRAIAEEIVRSDALGRVHVGLDFFDASINRIAAWTVGTRNILKALLLALLEPKRRLRELELAGDFTSRLALLEELKSSPAAEVWDEHCRRHDAPVGIDWLKAVKQYESAVLEKRR